MGRQLKILFIIIKNYFSWYGKLARKYKNDVLEMKRCVLSVYKNTDANKKQCKSIIYQLLIKSIRNNTTISEELKYGLKNS
ncbi:MAG: hypothetical protein GY870_11880 [archaeon]|nr:hypothetical protein [archaeon]